MYTLFATVTMKRDCFWARLLTELPLQSSRVTLSSKPQSCGWSQMPGAQHTVARMVPFNSLSLPLYPHTIPPKPPSPEIKTKSWYFNKAGSLKAFPSSPLTTLPLYQYLNRRPEATGTEGLTCRCSLPVRVNVTHTVTELTKGASQQVRG